VIVARVNLVGRQAHEINVINEHLKICGVIVNWNSGQLLDQCLTALNRQTLRFSEIIVVDNASTDCSACGIEKRYKGVRLIQLSRNMGFAAANNAAIAEIARTKDVQWFALINPDAFAEPDWLAKLMGAATNYPKYASFATRLLAGMDSGLLDGAGDVYHVSGCAWRRGHSQKAEGRHLKVEEIFAPCAGAALYRRDAFEEVGGFDDRYFCYLEDMDLGFRLQLAGYQCLYVPDAVVHHIGSAITGKNSDFTVYHGHRNLVWTYFKNMPWPLFWLYLPQHILLNLASILYFALHGRGRVILKAKWDALKGLPRVLRQRRKVQATRRVGAWELRRLMAKGLLTPYVRRRAEHRQ
jgi:GT2 family glycosyltransferase